MTKLSDLGPPNPGSCPAGMTSQKSGISTHARIVGCRLTSETCGRCSITKNRGPSRRSRSPGQRYSNSRRDKVPLYSATAGVGSRSGSLMSLACALPALHGRLQGGRLLFLTAFDRPRARAPNPLACFYAPLRPAETPMFRSLWRRRADLPSMA